MKTLYCIIGILLPLFGTSLGSGFVFFLNNKTNDRINKLLIGFAIGVMLSASIWSLLIPSLEMYTGKIKWLSAVIGFILGFLFLMLIKYIVKNYKNDKSFNMLMFSVTLHNIPEGMAVGVCFAGFLSSEISLMSALVLSLGIAIQNIPEGSIISLPLKSNGQNNIKSFMYGVLSGIVEPISSLLTIILLNIVVPLLPFLLSFAAGSMIYVIIDELIPEMNKSNYGIIGIMIGFILMMILDVALS